ncbi:DUF3085 domain-containing protein [Pseudomonas sp. B392_1p]|uniref:DUF3085 domain-containing protein n=1 Tax=Pseudomonas sp. B392_1p TaxID=3457507 RepID=UPI003FD317CF
MPLRFKGADLRPVLAESIANRCSLILVKDQGVYFIAEHGEHRPEDGRQKLVAYADGCNPDVDPFDDWRVRSCTELGENDFRWFFKPQHEVFDRSLSSTDDLQMVLAGPLLTLQAISLA